jgi:hypothetical protein
MHMAEIDDIRSHSIPTDDCFAMSADACTARYVTKIRYGGVRGCKCRHDYDGGTITEIAEFVCLNIDKHVINRIE